MVTLKGNHQILGVYTPKSRVNLNIHTSSYIDQKNTETSNKNITAAFDGPREPWVHQPLHVP